MADCPRCGGAGEYFGPIESGLHQGELVTQTCRRCGGTGQIRGEGGSDGAGCGAMIANWAIGWVVRIVMVVVGVLLLGAIVLGISWYRNRDHGLVEARPSSEVVTDGYAIGSCLNDPFAAALPVPCEQPHDGEIYRILEAKDPESDAWPGDRRLDAFAREVCLPFVEEYVGAAPADTDLKFGSRGPTEVEWKIGSRRVLCFAGGGTNGQITGVVQGSGGRAG